MSGLDRSQITFEQAEGVAPLPSQLALGELSRQLRSVLWAIVHGLLNESKSRSDYGYGGSYIGGPFAATLKDYWILHEFNFSDEYTNDFSFWEKKLGDIFKVLPYTTVFGFLQFVLRHRNCPHRFSQAIDSALQYGKAAYFVSGDTILPAATTQDKDVVEAALEASEKGGYLGARAHLVRAGGLLSQGSWADSVRESIHAVESVTRIISGEGATLSAALNFLQKQGRMNPNLKRAMNALYDYASDEHGVRHALIFGEADVSENDAVYMFSVCSAFVTYSIRTVREDI